MKEVTFTAIYDDGTTIENLSYQESYDLFCNAHGTDNQCQLRTSEYSRELRADYKRPY